MSCLPLRSLHRLLPIALPGLLLSSCIFSETPVVGGFASKISDPFSALEGEPAPTPPNSHMDPVILRNGAFNLRWNEDLGKSSSNYEEDPDDAKPRPGSR
ncbi:MAG: hypothetical protein KDN19_02815 [Verrucomicrobiae bacterium]|nr:hypothetical protein [Verrucomicrobiae bacterium]